MKRYMMKGLLGMLLCSCQGSPGFSNYSTVDREGWYREDTVVLPVWQPDPLRRAGLEQQLDLTVCVRYTDEYRYRNLALLMEMVSDRELVVRDTLRFSMFDENDYVQGRGLGRYSQTVHSARVALQPDRPYEVRITHLMRLNPVRGVTDISFSLDSVRHPYAER